MTPHPPDHPPRTDAAIVEVDDVPLRNRIEPVVWGITCRVGIRVMRLDTLVAVLDRFPRRRTATAAVEIPTTRHFRGGGACLSRSLARSQYLRTHGARSVVAVGVKGSATDLDAHAWLEPLDHEDHTPIHRIHR